LKNLSARGFDGMVVRQREIDGLIEADQRCVLPTAPPHEYEKKQRYRGEHSKLPGAHKGRDQSAAAKGRIVIDRIHDLRNAYF
jgi:hypothetical protein